MKGPKRVKRPSQIDDDEKSARCARGCARRPRSGKWNLLSFPTAPPSLPLYSVSSLSPSSSRCYSQVSPLIHLVDSQKLAPPSGAPPCSHFGVTARPANEAATRSWLLPAEEDSALGEDKHTSWLSSRQQESYENPMMLNAQAQEYDFVLNQQQRA
jgi:hypothetical protein